MEEAVPIRRPRRLSFRRAARAFSNILIVLGVLTMIWAFVIWKWSDPFTALYTKYEQHRLTKVYDSHAAIVEAALPAIPSKASLSVERHQIALDARAYRAEATTGEGIGRIIVKRLHLNMLLINGTDESSLQRGPGRDQRTYMPGQGQLVYIAGHRTTYLAPFSHIDEIKVGDLVTLTVPYGTFTYRVYKHVIVPATDLAVLKTHNKEVVILQACHPRFFATHRYLVYARLAHVTPTNGRPYEVG